MFRSSSLVLVAGLALMANSQSVKAQDETVVADQSFEEIIVYEDVAIDNEAVIAEEVAPEESVAVEADISEEAATETAVEPDASSVANEVVVEESYAEVVGEADESVEYDEPSTEVPAESELGEAAGYDKSAETAIEVPVLNGDDGGYPESEATEGEPQPEFEETTGPDFSYWGYFDNYPINASQTGRNIATERDYQLDNSLDYLGFGAENRGEYYSIMDNIEEEINDYHRLIDERYANIAYYNYLLSYAYDEDEIREYHEIIATGYADIEHFNNLINEIYDESHYYYNVKHNFDYYNSLIDFINYEEIFENISSIEDEGSQLHNNINLNLEEKWSRQNLVTYLDSDIRIFLHEIDYNFYYLTHEEIDNLYRLIIDKQREVFVNEDAISELEYKINMLENIISYLPENYYNPDVEGEEPEPEEEEYVSYTLTSSFIKHVEYDKPEVKVGEFVTMTIYLESVPESGKLSFPDYRRGGKGNGFMFSLDVPAGDSVQTVKFYPSAHDLREIGELGTDYTSVYYLQPNGNRDYIFNSIEQGRNNESLNSNNYVKVIPENIGYKELANFGIESIGFNVNSDGENNYYLWGTEEIKVKPGDVVSMIYNFKPDVRSNFEDFIVYPVVSSINNGYKNYGKPYLFSDNYTKNQNTTNQYILDFLVTDHDAGEFKFNQLNIYMNSMNVNFNNYLGGFMDELPKIVVNNEVFDTKKPVINDVRVNVIQGNSDILPVLIDDEKSIYQVMPGDIIQFILDIDSKETVDGVGLSYWGKVLNNQNGWTNFVTNEANKSGDKFNTIISLEITEDMIGEYKALLSAWNIEGEYVYDEYSEYYRELAFSDGLWHSFVVSRPGLEVDEPSQEEDVVDYIKEEIINELIQIPQLPDFRVPSLGLKPGEEDLMVQGEPGQMLITVKVTYKDGIEVSRETIGQEVIKEATATIIQYGVERPEEEQDDTETEIPETPVEETPVEEETDESENTEEETDTEQTETPDTKGPDEPEDENGKEPAEDNESYEDSSSDNANTDNPSNEGDDSEETVTEPETANPTPNTNGGSGSNSNTDPNTSEDDTNDSENDSESNSTTKPLTSEGKSGAETELGALLTNDFKVDQSAVLLPQTGESQNQLWFVASASAILLGLGLLKGRKEELDK